MNSKEGISQHGFGVEYKKNVSATQHKVSGHRDVGSQVSGTQSAFKKANQDSKKA